MKTLKNKINQDSKNDLKKFKESLKGVTIEKILNNWYFSDLLTPAKKRDIKNGSLSLSQVKKLLIEKKTAKIEARKNELLTRILHVSNAPDLENASITLTWIKSRTWGANPRPEMTVRTKENNFHYDAPSVTGCGYCKQSTAVANVLNQSPSILKLIYTHANKKRAFEYGISQSGSLPYFSGGVGVSCYQRAFKQLGFEMVQISNGENFDAYTITRMTAAEKKEYNKRGY